jgi:hypothetical protein
MKTIKLKISAYGYEELSEDAKYYAIFKEPKAKWKDDPDPFFTEDGRYINRQLLNNLGFKRD